MNSNAMLDCFFLIVRALFGSFPFPLCLRLLAFHCQRCFQHFELLGSLRGDLLAELFLLECFFLFPFLQTSLVLGLQFLGLLFYRFRVLQRLFDGRPPLRNGLLYRGIEEAA